MHLTPALIIFVGSSILALTESGCMHAEVLKKSKQIFR